MICHKCLAESVLGRGIAMFRTMVSHRILEFTYILGVIASVIFVFTDPNPATILTALAFNLIWRVAFEGMIVIFDIHRSLVAIEGVVTRNVVQDRKDN